MATSKGLAARTVILLVTGVIVMAFALYFLSVTFMSNGTALSVNDCKSIMSNQCAICIVSSQCRLDAKSNGCVPVLNGLGISLAGDGSFDKSECGKLGAGECGGPGQQCCYDTYCSVGECDKTMKKCVASQ